MDTDPTGLLIRLAIGAAAGGFAYHWARGFETRFGERPMKTAPWGWGLFTFFFLPLGLIALGVTSFKARNRPRVRRSGPETSPAEAWIRTADDQWAVAPPTTAPSSGPRVSSGSTAPAMTILPGSPPPR